MSKGRFIVLEGIDGAGTTTQTSRLVARLKKAGHAARPTREPSDGPVGTIIRQVLMGRIVGARGLAPGWATMALLFAADRMDHVESEIEPFLAQGGTVVSDRYDASSLAYQSVMSGAKVPEAVEWIRALNQHARRPDLTVVLDLNPDVAASRREARGEAAQLYEQNEVQRALSVFYKNLPKHMPNDRIVIVDGDADPDTISDRVYQAVSA